MTPQTTNDELAQMIKEGFDGVDRRFDLFDRQLEKIEKLILKNHEHRIQRIEDALAIPSK